MLANINPMADRIRVTTTSGLNFRLSPNSGTGYTNSFAGATATTLYTLDSLGNQLLIQNPPNNGTQTLPLPVTLAGNPLDFTDFNGFDIPRTVSVATSNTAATGSGTVAFTVGGVTGLYSLNLATGATTLLGTIGAGATPLLGLTIGN